MNKFFVSALAALVISAGAASAQDDPIAIATESGVCGDAVVESAVFDDSGAISAVCAGGATAFVPALGAAGALLGALLLAGGGDAPGDTSGTSGTNGTGN